MYLTVDEAQHKTESVNVKTINEKYPNLSTEKRIGKKQNRAKEAQACRTKLKKSYHIYDRSPRGTRENQVEAEFENDQEFSKTDEKYQSTDSVSPVNQAGLKKK